MTISKALYDFLTDDENTRVPADISDEARHETPRNFVLILLTHVFTKLGDAVASPKTTLAWVVNVVGAPPFVLGFLVPIRESGSLIPQLFIGNVIRRLAIRKWVWAIASVAQALAIGGIGWVVYSLEGIVAGWSILLLLIFFSLARGFCSVTSKDIVGKTIPKTKRGQLAGWSASAAGLITVGVGVVLILPATRDADASLYGALLAAAGLLWVLAAALYSRVREFPGETGRARGALEAVGRLRILVTDAPFRKFVMTRALLMCSALSAPFYIAMAQDALGSPAYMLGFFVAAAGTADLVAAPLWGRFSDRSSKKVMIAAALVTSGCGIVIFLADRFVPVLIQTAWFLPAAYFVLAIAHSGVRVGRKTYVVDLASGNRRTDYVAVSNSVIGVLLLLVGLVGTLTPIISIGGVIVLLALMGLAGAGLGATLPEVQR